MFLLYCLCVLCLSAEARCLVQALLQSDPTVRLTAEKTLLHPWVKAMASICRQRALTDKPENTVHAGAEPERVQRPAQINAEEAATGKRHTSSEVLPTHKVELSRHYEGQAEMSTGRRKEENIPPQQLLIEISTVQSVSPQIKAHTPSEATPGHQKPKSSSTDSPRERVIQHSGLNLSNTNCDSISPTSPSQLNAPAAQTETVLTETHQSTQKSLQQTPYLQPPTTVGHSTQHHPSSHPAATSSTHSLHQQNFSSPLNNPTTATTQNHSAKSHDYLTTDTTINHPHSPAQPQPH